MLMEVLQASQIALLQHLEFMLQQLRSLQLIQVPLSLISSLLLTTKEKKVSLGSSRSTMTSRSKSLLKLLILALQLLTLSQMELLLLLNLRRATLKTTLIQTDHQLILVVRTPMNCLQKISKTLKNSFGLMMEQTTMLRLLSLPTA